MFNIIRKFIGYRINFEVLKSLEQSNLPNNILIVLKNLNDKHYITKKAFVTAIHANNNNFFVSQYMSNILQSAKILPLSQLKRKIHYIWTHVIPRSRLRPSIYQYIRTTPLILFLQFKTRYLFFVLVAKLTGHNTAQEMPNTNINGYKHNFKALLVFLSGHRDRTESLMNILRTIRGVDLKKSTLLCVGPRNEGEVLLFPYYGFSKKNIKAIDLFSYSPRVKIMDMNDIKYDDNSFDIYYSAAVITYSPNIILTVSESIRVTKPGGLIVISFGDSGKANSLTPDGSDLNTLSELKLLYDGYIDYIFWQEEYYWPAEKAIRNSIIFRLKK